VASGLAQFSNQAPKLLLKIKPKTKTKQNQNTTTIATKKRFDKKFRN
jgi:hypothetical protein